MTFADTLPDDLATASTAAIAAGAVARRALVAALERAPVARPLPYVLASPEHAKGGAR